MKTNEITPPAAPPRKGGNGIKGLASAGALVIGLLALFSKQLHLPGIVVISIAGALVALLLAIVVIAEVSRMPSAVVLMTLGGMTTGYFALFADASPSDIDRLIGVMIGLGLLILGGILLSKKGPPQKGAPGAEN